MEKDAHPEVEPLNDSQESPRPSISGRNTTEIDNCSVDKAEITSKAGEDGRKRPDPPNEARPVSSLEDARDSSRHMTIDLTDDHGMGSEDTIEITTVSASNRSLATRATNEEVTIKEEERVYGPVFQVNTKETAFAIDDDDGQSPGDIEMIDISTPTAPLFGGLSPRNTSAFNGRIDHFGGDAASNSIQFTQSDLEEILNNPVDGTLFNFDLTEPFDPEGAADLPMIGQDMDVSMDAERSERLDTSSGTLLSFGSQGTSNPLVMGLNLGSSILGPPKESSSGDDERPSRQLLLARARENMRVMAMNSGTNVRDGPVAQIDRTNTAQMNQQDQLDSQAAHKAFQKKKEEYEQLRESGLNTLADDIEFSRAEKEDRERLKKARLDWIRYAEEIDSERKKEEERRPAENAEGSCRKRSQDDEGDPSNTETPNDGEDKSPSRRHDRAEGPRKKQKGSESSSTDAKPNKNKGPTKAKGKRGKAKPSRLFNLSKLGVTNAFSDAVGSEESRNPPTFTERNKDKVLKELIASVPQEHRDIAKVDSAHLLQATRDFTGHGSCYADQNGGWIIKGMKTSLKNYQVLGAAFMRRRENSDDHPKGGLCADDMGLGKTVTMLANIINGRPNREDSTRTTLIVTPASLTHQWYNEIKKHCEEDAAGKVTIWYSRKARVGEDDEDIGNYDIVITTYSQVMRSYPEKKPPTTLQTEEEKQKWWDNHFETHKGPLHSVNFHRIVLDEAQAIKNHNSRTSKACRTLKRRFSWAMSGTPLMNSISEMYPFFKFLRVPYTGPNNVFKHNYCGTQTSIDRLNFILGGFMLRRSRSDTMFGAPILKLPRVSQNIHWCTFNDLERNIYEIVRKRMIDNINRMSRRKQLEQNYWGILSMILKLRQLCGHILMVNVALQDLLTLEDHEKLKAIAEAENHPDMKEDRGKQLIALRRVLASYSAENSRPRPPLREDILDHLNNSQVGNQVDPITIEDDDQGKSFGKENEFFRYLEDLRNSKKVEEFLNRSLCTSCSHRPSNPHITSCYHVYCKSCVEEIQQLSAERDQDCAQCIECGSVFNNAWPVHENAIENARRGRHPFDTDGDIGSAQNSKTYKDKRDMENVRRWITNHADVLPSAKTVAVKAQIMNWLTEDPTVKIIIYTQFISMILILEKICQSEGWGCQKFYGGMNVESRKAAIEQFGSDSDCKVLLASLKCGGVGLNLTMASKVICVDLWWNHAAEQQAFCRVHRIGQSKETSLTRFVVEDTIDKKLIEMQEEKQTEIDKVMSPGFGKRKPLSIQEMISLFGPVANDKDGQPFIVVDDVEKKP